MSKELEALERISLVYISTDTPTIERELRALEIIKNKKVNVNLLLDTQECPDLDHYNCYAFQPLTQEEYDLLSEVLL